MDLLERHTWFFNMPDAYKTIEMCELLVKDYPEFLEYVPDRLKSVNMCEEAVNKESATFQFVPDNLKTRLMCSNAVCDNIFNLQFVPDWIVTQICDQVFQDLQDVSEDELLEAIDELLERVDDFSEDEMLDYSRKYFRDMIEDKLGFIKRFRVLNKDLKLELMPVAWHPDRWWHWCVDEEEKKKRAELVWC